MNIRRRVALGLAAALVCVAAFLHFAPRARADYPTGGPAPAWTLPDVEGRPVVSADFAGKVVVVDFWATWCPPCVKEVPGYVELQEKYRDRGLVIVGISLDSKGPGVVRDFMKKHRVNYPMVMGDDATVKAFGGVRAIPTTFVIDREGVVRHVKVGYVPHEEFERQIVPLL